MASIYRDNARNGWRCHVVIRGHSRKLWLGPITKTQAAAIGRHLDALKHANLTGTAPPDQTARWARAVGPRIRGNLERWGLVAAGPAIPRTLGAFVDWYLAEQNYTAKSTASRWAGIRRRLVAQWPEHWPLDEITPGDCDRFAATLRSSARSSHAGKILADCRQLFRAAERHRLIDSNPWAEIDCSQKHDRARESYVPPAVALDLIAAADPQMAAVIALARFGGLRIPSEPLAVELAGIDWAGGRFTVPACKTAARQIPLFPELRPALAHLAELAPDGATYLIWERRDSANKTWRKFLLRLIENAGLEPWPKLWQNMRASCRTDLEERFPAFVVDAWLGHSSAVGRKHYTRVHDQHFTAAACSTPGGVQPGSVGQPVGRSARQHPTPPDTKTATPAAKSRKTRRK